MNTTLPDIGTNFPITVATRRRTASFHPVHPVRGREGALARRTFALLVLGAVALAAMGILDTTRAQTTNPVCVAGEVAVIDNTGAVACRALTEAMTGLCAAGEILQKGNGVLQCAANNDVEPTGSTHPPSTPAATPSGSGCGPNQVAVSSSACRDVGAVLSAAASGCANGDFIHPSNGTAYCDNYRSIENAASDLTALPSPAASTSLPCGDGRVLRSGAAGLQCVGAGEVFAEAFACAAGEVVVFDDEGVPACGAPHTCAADEVVVKVTESTMVCKALTEVMAGLCPAGQILQMGTDTLQCAMNNAATPTGDDYPRNSSQTSGGASGCDKDEVAVLAGSDGVGCKDIGAILNETAFPCLEGDVFRFVRDGELNASQRIGGLVCKDYDNGPDYEELVRNTASGSQCRRGQALGLAQTGLKCIPLADVVEHAFACTEEHQSVVFDANGVPTCGDAATSCPAGAQTWQADGNACSFNADKTFVNHAVDFDDGAGPNSGAAGATGEATFECMADGWSEQSGSTCSVDGARCPRELDDFQCAAESPGTQWLALPSYDANVSNSWYCTNDTNKGLVATTETCFQRMLGPTNPTVPEDTVLHDTATLQWDDSHDFAAGGFTRADATSPWTRMVNGATRTGGYQVSLHLGATCSDATRDDGRSGVVTPPAAGEKVFSDLTPDTTYSARVRAVESDGTGGHVGISEWSACQTITTMVRRTSCPAGEPRTWTVDNQSCSARTTATAVDTQVTLTDGKGLDAVGMGTRGSTGTATFACSQRGWATEPTSPVCTVDPKLCPTESDDGHQCATISPGMAWTAQPLLDAIDGDADDALERYCPAASDGIEQTCYKIAPGPTNLRIKDKGLESITMEWDAVVFPGYVVNPAANSLEKTIDGVRYRGGYELAWYRNNTCSGPRVDDSTDWNAAGADALFEQAMNLTPERKYHFQARAVARGTVNGEQRVQALTGWSSCVRATVPGTCPADDEQTWTVGDGDNAKTCRDEVARTHAGGTRELTDGQGPDNGAPGVAGAATLSCTDDGWETGGGATCTADALLCPTSQDNHQCTEAGQEHSPGTEWELAPGGLYCTGQDLVCHRKIPGPTNLTLNDRAQDTVTMQWDAHAFPGFTPGSTELGEGAKIMNIGNVTYQAGYELAWHAGTDTQCASPLLDSEEVMHVGTLHRATAPGLAINTKYHFRVRAVGIPRTGSNPLRVLTDWSSCEAASTTVRSLCRTATDIGWTHNGHACRADAPEALVGVSANLTDGPGSLDGMRTTQGTAMHACTSTGWAAEPTNTHCEPSANLCPDNDEYRCAASKPSGWSASANTDHFCADASHACYVTPPPKKPKNVHAHAATPDSITVAWNEAQRAQHYEVYRFADLGACRGSTKGSGGSRVGGDITVLRVEDTGTTVFQIEDTGAGDTDPDVDSFVYGVWSVNAGGATRSACKELDNVALATPTGLHAPDGAVGGSGLTMQWDSVRPALTYDLRRYTDAECTTQDHDFPDAEGTSVVVPASMDIDSGSTHYFRVRAIRNAVQGNFSSCVAVTVDCPKRAKAWDNQDGTKRCADTAPRTPVGRTRTLTDGIGPMNGRVGVTGSMTFSCIAGQGWVEGLDATCGADPKLCPSESGNDDYRCEATPPGANWIAQPLLDDDDNDADDATERYCPADEGNAEQTCYKIASGPTPRVAGRGLRSITMEWDAVTFPGYVVSSDTNRLEKIVDGVRRQGGYELAWYEKGNCAGPHAGSSIDWNATSDGFLTERAAALEPEDTYYFRVRAVSGSGATGAMDVSRITDWSECVAATVLGTCPEEKQTWTAGAGNDAKTCSTQAKETHVGGEREVTDAPGAGNDEPEVEGTATLSCTADNGWSARDTTCIADTLLCPTSRGNHQCVDDSSGGDSLGMEWETAAAPGGLYCADQGFSCHRKIPGPENLTLNSHTQDSITMQWDAYAFPDFTPGSFDLGTGAKIRNIGIVTYQAGYQLAWHAGTDTDCTSAMIDDDEIKHAGTLHSKTVRNLAINREYRFRVRAVGIFHASTDANADTNGLKILTDWSSCEAASTTARSICHAATGIKWTEGTHSCIADAPQTSVGSEASLVDGSGPDDGVRASQGTATLACTASGWATDPTNKDCEPSTNLCPSDDWHQCADTKPTGWVNSTNAGHFCPDASHTCFELPLPPPPSISKTSATPDSITIGWSAVGIADHYRIFRYSSSSDCEADLGNGVNGAAVGGDITALQITDNGAGDTDAAADTYHYWAESVNARGSSPANTLECTQMSNVALGTPTNLNTTGTIAANTSFRMNWNGVTHALMYDMRRYTDANCETLADDFTDTQNPYQTVEAADNLGGNSHYYRVRALRNAVVGDFSACNKKVDIPCPGESLQWTNASRTKTCGVTAPKTNVGSSTPLTDGTGPSSGLRGVRGSATYSCTANEGWTLNAGATCTADPKLCPTDSDDYQCTTTPPGMAWNTQPLSDTNDNDADEAMERYCPLTSNGAEQTCYKITPAPANLRVKERGLKSITMQWDAVTFPGYTVNNTTNRLEKTVNGVKHQAGYELAWYTNSTCTGTPTGSSTDRNATGDGFLFEQATGLTPTHTYYFQVKGVTGSGTNGTANAEDLTDLSECEPATVLGTCPGGEQTWAVGTGNNAKTCRADAEETYVGDPRKQNLTDASGAGQGSPNVEGTATLSCTAHNTWSKENTTCIEDTKLCPTSKRDHQCVNDSSNSNNLGMEWERATGGLYCADQGFNCYREIPGPVLTLSGQEQDNITMQWDAYAFPGFTAAANLGTGAKTKNIDNVTYQAGYELAWYGGTDTNCTAGMIDSVEVEHLGTSHTATAGNLAINQRYHFRVKAIAIDAAGANDPVAQTGWSSRCMAASTTARTVCRAATGIEWTVGDHTCRTDVPEADVGDTRDINDGQRSNEGVRTSQGTATLSCTANGWASEPTNKHCMETILLCPGDNWHRCARTKPSGWLSPANSEHFCPDSRDSCYELPLPSGPVLSQADNDPGSITIGLSTSNIADYSRVYRYSNLSTCNNDRTNRRTTNGTRVGGNITSTQIKDSGAGDTDPAADFYYYLGISFNNRGSAFGTCTSMSTAALPKPTNLRTSGTIAVGNTFTLHWNQATYATGYEIGRYDNSNCTGRNQDLGSTTTTLSKQVASQHNTAGRVDYLCVRSKWSSIRSGFMSLKVTIDCPSETKRWTSGAKACSATVPKTSPGSSRQLTDGTGMGSNSGERGTRGSATYMCIEDTGWGSATSASCTADPQLCPGGNLHQCASSSPGSSWHDITSDNDYCQNSSHRCYVKVSPPTNLKWKSSTTTSITMKWTHSTGARTSYQARMYANKADCDNDRNHVDSYPAQVAEIRMVGFPNHRFSAGKIYYGNVRAYYTARNNVKKYSTWAGCRKLATKPPKVTGLRDTSSTHNSIAMRWDRAVDSERYQLKRYGSCGDNANTAGALAYDDSNTSGTATGLAKSSTYHFRARAAIDVQYGTVYGDWSDCDTARTTEVPFCDNGDTKSGCERAGGSVYDTGSCRICKFNRSSCPSGWSRYGGNNSLIYTATSARTCTIACEDEDEPEDGETSGYEESCTTGSHSFRGVSGSGSSYSDGQEVCLASCDGDDEEGDSRYCRARVTAIGCVQRSSSSNTTPSGPGSDPPDPDPDPPPYIPPHDCPDSSQQDHLECY